MNGTFIAALVFFIALSFLFSGMEAGVFALSRLRVRHLMRAGNHRAKVLYGYLENPENFLWTILLGNTLSNLAAVSMGVMGLHRWLWPWPWLLFAGLVVGILLFYAACELLPKMLFRLYPNRLCMALAVPFRVVHLALKPIVAPVTFLSRLILRWSGGRRFTGHLFGNRDELRIVMQESADDLTNEERTMINRVLDLQNLTLKQITIPLAKTVTLPADAPVDEILAKAREHGCNRIPVWQEEGGRQRITGLVSLWSILYKQIDPKKTAADFLTPALFLDNETRLEEALRQMQRTGQGLAIVLAADRSVLGVASLQDILKVIFGEMKW